MKKSIYKEIAKKYGVSVDEVKKDMEEAISEAYLNPTLSAKSVPRKGEIPTVDEFIGYIVEKIKNE